MHNLGITYAALERHQDALVMGQKTLEFRRRVLSNNHPDVGSSYLSIALSHHRMGDLRQGVGMAREALRILQATLPSSHSRVAQARELVRLCKDDTARRE